MIAVEICVCRKIRDVNNWKRKREPKHELLGRKEGHAQKSKRVMQERKWNTQAETDSACVYVSKIRPRNDKLVVNWCSIIPHAENTLVHCALIKQVLINRDNRNTNRILRHVHIHTFHIQYTACVTWLWTKPTSTVRANMFPVDVNGAAGLR